jgi:hypothetical protein
MINIFNKYLSRNEFTIRVDNNNKLFVDFKLDHEYSKLVDDLYKFDIDLNEIFISFKSNLNLNKLLKINLDEFFLGLCSAIISIKCRFKNLLKLLLFFNQKEEKAEKGEEDYYPINFIKIVKFIINILMFMQRFDSNLSAINLSQFLVKNLIPNEKKDLQDFVKDITHYLNNHFPYEKDDLLKYVNIDNFFVSILFVKYKSGFALDMKNKGLTNVVNEIISSQ